MMQEGYPLTPIEVDSFLYRPGDLLRDRTGFYFWITGIVRLAKLGYMYQYAYSSSPKFEEGMRQDQSRARLEAQLETHLVTTNWRKPSYA